MAGRPSRRAAKRKRYTVDAFEGIEALAGSESSSPVSVPESVDEDNEFDLAESHHSSSAEESDIDEDASRDGEAEGDDNANDKVLESGEDIVHVSSKSRPRPFRIGGPSARARANAQGRFTRGFIETFVNHAKEERILTMTGSGEEDLIAFARSRDAWMNAEPLPSRRVLSKLYEQHDRTPFHRKSRLDHELSHDWNWYHENGGLSTFHEHQKIVQSISQVFPPDWPYTSKSASFLIGSTKSPSLYELSGGDCVDLNRFFTSKTNAGSCRSGWLLNFGSAVHCLEWLPHKETSEQYLAVASRLKNDASKLPADDPTSYDDNQSAFAARPPEPSYLYIYRFKASEKPKNLTRIDDQAPPKLVAVFSFDWNHLKSIKWCPVPHQHQKTLPNRIELGLVACVTHDGYVRVLDLSIPHVSESEDPVRLHVVKAAFQSRPPNTVCTAVTWLSASSIAVGCADGSIAIWEISKGLGKSNPRPWFYEFLHHSYVLNIVSGYPSRATYIFSNCANGSTKMTDMRDPRADTSYPTRHRLILPPLTWLDICQVVLLADDAGNLEGPFLRYFFSALQINRFSGLVQDIAASPIHPYVLVGTANGQVGCVNIMSKTRGIKKAANIRQMIYHYEWRDAISPVNSNEMQHESSTNNNTLCKPLGRFVDGFKPELVSLHSTAHNRAKFNFYNATIHEDNTAITKVAWNPNKRCSSWTASATASGLIRIQDLAID